MKLFLIYPKNFGVVKVFPDPINHILLCLTELIEDSYYSAINSHIKT